jgi:hypothetical protein
MNVICELCRDFGLWISAPEAHPPSAEDLLLIRNEHINPLRMYPQSITFFLFSVPHKLVVPPYLPHAKP